jgi:hypothetical protein
MPTGFQRQARKWAIKELSARGVMMPENVSYLDVSVELLKHAREITGRPVLVDGASAEGLLQAMYADSQIRSLAD